MQKLTVTVIGFDDSNRQLLLSLPNDKASAAKPRSKESVQDELRELLPNLRASLNVLQAFAEANKSQAEELETARVLCRSVARDVKELGLDRELASEQATFELALKPFDKTTVVATRAALERLAKVLGMASGSRR
jgi:hypothetical protein